MGTDFPQKMLRDARDYRHGYPTVMLGCDSCTFSTFRRSEADQHEHDFSVGNHQVTIQLPESAR
jgi:hypothetical protein